jgi:multidrug efflux system membrane fusion protein
MGNQPLSDLLRLVRRAAGPPGSALSDGELLGRFADGRDQAAFEALVWRHAPLVLGVCRRLLGHAQDAEDAFQAAFLVLARKAGSVRRRDAVGPWLYRVAHRAALRARGRSAARGLAHPLPDGLAAPTASGEADHHDLRRVLDEEVGRLPAKYREPIVLRYLEGRSTSETAALLGCPQGTVLSRLAWARRRLRVRLAARGVGLPAALALAVAEAAGAVPARWAASAAGAALPFAEAGVGLTRPAVLAEGVLKAMLMTKLRVGAVLVLGALAVGAGLLAPGPTAGQPEGAAPPVEVTVVKPVRREAAEHADFVGRTEPAAWVEVRPRVSGLVERVAFRPGAPVKRGDVLFELDARASQAECAKAEAEVQRAEARLRRVEADLARTRQLKANLAVGQDEVDRFTGEREETRAVLQAARAGLERARLDLDAARVRAPIDGRVGRPLLDAGNLAGPATPLATLVATDPLYAAIDVDERTYLKLRKLLQEEGCVALMGLAGEEGFPRRGQVEFADVRADPATGTIRVRAAFPNPGGDVLPGLSARVRLVTGASTPELLVPASTVRTVEGRPSVLVVSNGAVEWRAVTLGAAEGGLRVVRAGLGPDDRVIVGSLANIRPGVPVRPREADPSGK